MRDNVQCETTYKCLSCCNKSETCSIFAPETAEGWKAGSGVAYCLEYNKTRPPSTDSDHKQSSNASNVDLDNAKQTLFSHSKTAAKPATSIKTKSWKMSKFVSAGGTEIINSGK